MGEFYLITFKNTHDAISAEKLLKQKDLKPVIMPTPTYMTKSCGISIKLRKEVIENIVELVKTRELTIKDLFKYESGKFLSINIEEL